MFEYKGHIHHGKNELALKCKTEKSFLCYIVLNCIQNMMENFAVVCWNFLSLHKPLNLDECFTYNVPT